MIVRKKSFHLWPKTGNSELHDELPALHDSRILFLVTNMQTLFAAEDVFHSETAKVIIVKSPNVDWVILSKLLLEFPQFAKRWLLKGGASSSHGMTC